MKYFDNLHKLFKAFTLLLILGLWTGNSYAQINLTTPGSSYTENFDATTGLALPTNWTVIDANTPPDGAANGKGKWNTFETGVEMTTTANIAFGGTGRCLSYLYNATNTANDWAITPALSLVTGQSYRMSFKYAGLGTIYTEKMKVFIGNSPTVAGMTTQLQDYPTINFATYADGVINFTVASTGTYYIGFNAYSAADQWHLRVDNLEVTALVANDVAYSNITTTAAAINCSSFTATTPINIQISNPGTANQTNVQINYSVTRNGSAFTSGNVTVPAINAGTTASASFNLDMTVGGTYVVTATTALGTDQVSTNNTGSVTLLNPFVDLTATGAAFLQTFETATTTTTLASAGFQAGDANADNVSWTLLNNANFTNQIYPGTKAAICFRSQTVASNDWLFTNCMRLKGSTTYTISFYRRANGGTSEKLKLSYGTTPTAAGMTNLIQDYGTFNQNSFVLVTSTFTTPAGDNTYYLGFHNYGDAINATGTTPPATANGIIIDDIYVLNPASNDLAVTNATTTANTCSMTNATPVTITFANAGTAAFASSFTWEVRNANNNNLLASSANPITIPSIGVGGTATVNVNYDFSSPATIYSLKIVLANDGNNVNNERVFTFINAKRDLLTTNSSYTDDFENVALSNASWTALDGNADNSTWAPNTTAGFSASGTRFYAALSPATTTANDWLFSPCLNLKAGKVYNLSFKHRTTTTAQNLTVNLMSVNNSTTAIPITVIQSYPSLLSATDAYTTVNLTFFVPLANGDGIYYIGFKNGSSASASNYILLDDIAITNTGVDAIPPATPTNFTATSTNAFIADLSWTAPSGVASYILERSLTAGSGFTQIATPAAAATAYQDAGLVGGTTYYYRLTAVNQYGNSTATTAQVTVLSPPAPTNLTASSPSVLTINLSWTDLANETGYIVERSTTSGSGFAQIGSNLAANTTTYQDQGGLSAGTTYYYRVRGIYSGGNSAPSNEASQMPMAPPVVTGLTAVAGTGANALTIALSWTDVANETGYTIERSTTSGSGFTALANVGASSTSPVTYTDNNNLVGGTTYYYRIIANYTLGNAAASTQANATAVNPPLPSAFTSITATNITAVAATINWSDVNFETSYDIERANGLNASTGFAVVGTVNANIVSFNNTGLSPNTSYTYRVVAKNTTGNTTSNTVNVTTLNVPIPSAPSNLTAVYSVSNPFAISLAWNDVTGEDSYIIERSTSATGTFTQIGTTSANIVGYVDNNLTANTTYFYRVKAKNVSGDSPASNVASATVLSIENNAISQQTSVFPNPNNGEFHVALPNMKVKQVTFNLVNAEGRKVFSTIKENDNADQFDFQLMNLPKGVYMLHIDTPKGQAVKRVVIK